MAKEQKKKIEKEEDVEDEAGPGVEAPKPTGKKRPAGIVSGLMVHFHRDVNTQIGNKLDLLPAMILKEADAASNFKDEDAAVDLKVFTKHGDEVKNGIMYSEEPKNGYWSFINYD